MIYSKRHIKGLPSPKEIVVKSLSDYMKLFSSEKLTNYIYRGEPTNYHSTISSALRGKEYPFIQMKNEFKREIYHRLSADEKKDFLAFAQHHGIPTNLRQHLLLLEESVFQQENQHRVMLFQKLDLLEL